MKRLLLLGSLALSACGAVPSQPYLDDARLMCAAGHGDYCSWIPALQSRVNAEKQQQAGEVAIGVLGALGALAEGFGEGYAATHQVYEPVIYQPVVVCRWRCW